MTLEVIAEASPNGTLRSFGAFVPSIDGEGRVAFQATRSDGATRVLVGDGNALDTLACDGPHIDHEVVSHPVITPRGIAWIGRRGTNDALLFHDGSRVEALLDNSYPGIDAIGPLGPTSEDRGAIAVRASWHGRPAIVVLRDGLVDAWTDGTLPRMAGLPLLSEGDLVVRADDVRGRNVVLRVRGKEESVLLATGKGLASIGSFPCVDGARVACGVRRADGTEALVEVLPDPQHLHVILEAGADFSSLRGVLVAGEHTVFYATPHGGELAVYVLGREPKRIVGLGQKLDGSRVSDLALNPVSIHRAGWLAIRLALEDGRERIVRVALPPLER
jgi:hypothetical protein